jgi:hypothetical protein
MESAKIREIKMKLTLVNVVYKGKTFSEFVFVKTINGKTFISNKLLKNLLKRIGIKKKEIYFMGLEKSVCHIFS